MGEPFRHRLRVRFHECDPQGVVFNAHYLAYCDVCLTEMWRETVHGYSAMTGTGIDVVVAEARVRFLAPLRFDEEFEIQLGIKRLGTTSMQLEFRFERDGEAIAEAEMAQVFIELEHGGKIEIPDEVRKGLEPYVTG